MSSYITLIAQVAELRLKEYGIYETISEDMVRAVVWANYNASVELLSSMRAKTMTRQSDEVLESDIVEQLIEEG